MAIYELCGDNPNNRSAREALGRIDASIPVHTLPVGPLTDSCWADAVLPIQYPRNFIQVRFLDGGAPVLATNVSLIKMVMTGAVRADLMDGQYCIGSSWKNRSCLGASIPLNVYPSTETTFTQWTRRDDTDPYLIEIWTVPNPCQCQTSAPQTYSYVPITSVCWWYDGNYYWQHYSGIGYIN